MKTFKDLKIGDYYYDAFNDISKWSIYKNTIIDIKETALGKRFFWQDNFGGCGQQFIINEALNDSIYYHVPGMNIIFIDINDILKVYESF